MKHSLQFLLFLILILNIGVNHVYAQFLVKETYFNPTGVSNQGIVAGYTAQSGPYSLWNADEGTTIEIGGAAPGMGVGGLANFSADGIKISGTNYDTVISSGNDTTIYSEMAVYNRTKSSWTFLGSLGFSSDFSRSSGFNISSDGNTIVGNAWADPANGNGTTPYTHAVAWNATEGLMDMGSLYSNINRSTRAEAVSGNGVVIVGWQDYNGPWKAALWKKNPAGGYFPNQYLLINPEGDSLDEFNQLGWAHAVSDDGIWIGGDGDYANNDEPWLWSEATGYKPLGKIAEGSGKVTGINHDGSVVIGWFDMGMWDPAVPFIWIKDKGMMNLNSYITDTLNFTMPNGPVYVPNSISFNGDYITGWGYDPNIGTWGDYFTFRLDLTTVNSAENKEPGKVSVYPNPAHDYVTVEATYDFKQIELFSPNGSLLKSISVGSQVCRFSISNLPHGVYAGRAICKDSVIPFKLIKK